MDSRCVTQVMKTWLTAGTAFPLQTRMQSDLFESPLKLVDGDPLRVPSKKKGSVGVPGG
jgi:hypothetical protein